MKKAFLFSLVCLGMASAWTLVMGASDPHAAHDSETPKSSVQPSASWNAMMPAAELRKVRFSSYAEYEDAAHRIMMSDNRAYLNGDTGNAFAISMTLHHQGAILSSLGVRGISNDPEVTALAQSIIDAQSREVKEMQDLIASGKLQGHSNPGFEKQMRDIMAGMMKRMTVPQIGIPPGKAVRIYLENMVVHHEAAIGMARAYLVAGKDESLRKLSEDIVRTQTEEISLMTRMLK